MTPSGSPWWYSGDDEDLNPPRTTDDEPEAAADQAPAEPAPTDEEPARTDDGAALDWTALAVGAQRLVDWASERLLAPHAEHVDPGEHPDCVVCRTQLLLGERGASGTARDVDDDGAFGDPAGADNEPRGSAGEPVVTWIPILDGDVGGEDPPVPSRPSV